MLHRRFLSSAVYVLILNYMRNQTLSLSRIHEMFLVYLDCFNYRRSKLPNGMTDRIKVTFCK